MPKKPILPPVDLGEESIGKRIARLRKENGLTQKELAEKVGISRSIISDYEIGRIRLYDDVIIRVALALKVTTDEILGLKETQNLNIGNINRNMVKRLQLIEKLPAFDKKSLIKTIDNALKGVEPTLE